MSKSDAASGSYGNWAGAGNFLVNVSDLSKLHWTSTASNDGAYGITVYFIDNGEVATSKSSSFQGAGWVGTLDISGHEYLVTIDTSANYNFASYFWFE